MSARWWLTPRIRKALVRLYETPAATPVASIPEPEFFELVGKYATNIVRSMVARGLVRELIPETGVTQYQLTPRGLAEARRIVVSLERRPIS